ncbi:hypothetical protein BCR34DRAFT_352847 [Clohesyomyces aquaticus]|uniref:Uncharacterized protein n=1 Tax=Clohesyomyces aquaticus TaxID=1231657 RepID=A0A1Y1ZJE9_9PLEO|nr:hypothetical protein BCR34DRAFT_352847 [Clohesyomyces aquaticus]
MELIPHALSLRNNFSGAGCSSDSTRTPTLARGPPRPRERLSIRGTGARNTRPFILVGCGGLRLDLRRRAGSPVRRALLFHLQPNRCIWNNTLSPGLPRDSSCVSYILHGHRGLESGASSQPTTRWLSHTRSTPPSYVLTSASLTALRRNRTSKANMHAASPIVAYTRTQVTYWSPYRQPSRRDRAAARQSQVICESRGNQSICTQA